MEKQSPFDLEFNDHSERRELVYCSELDTEASEENLIDCRSTNNTSSELADLFQLIVKVFETVKEN